MNETKIEQGLKENLSRLVQAQAFQNFIIAVIILNGIVLGLETSNRAMALAGPLLLAVDRLCLTQAVPDGIYRGNLPQALRPAQRFFQGELECFRLFGGGHFPGAAPRRIGRAAVPAGIAGDVHDLIPAEHRVVAAMLHALPGVSSVAGIVAIIFYVSAVISRKLFG